MDESNDREWMTAQEVCDYIKCSRSTLYRMRVGGRLASCPLSPGGSLRFMRSDVNRYLKNNATGFRDDGESMSDVVSDVLR